MAKSSPRISYFLILSFVLFLFQFGANVHAVTIYSKDKTYLSVGSGSYYPTFSSSSGCPLTLGYISSQYFNVLGSLSYSKPTTFNIIAANTISYSTVTPISLTQNNGYDYFFVLFNNNTANCYSVSFTTSLTTTSLYSGSDKKVTIAGQTTETFQSTIYSSSYSNSLVITSTTSSPFSISYYCQALYSAPSSVPSSSYFSSRQVSGSPVTITLPFASSSQEYYIFIRCTSTNCPLSLRVDSSDSGSSTVDASAIIGGIIGPIVFIIIFVFIVIISVTSTIVARRRRMLYLAAATTSVASTTTTYMNQPVYVPPPLVTTTTTEKTTLYSMPPTTAQQPFVPQGQQPPIAQQPYNPSYPVYGNQTYYSQIQPNQPQYNQQPYPNNQPQPPPYYNPGVGVYMPPPTSPNVPMQEPIPAFNPNVDRV